MTKQEILTLINGAVINIAPGVNPQTIFDAAAAGSYIRFLPGTHTWGINSNRAILNVTKSMAIELMAGAVLKLADNTTALEVAGEITTNQGPYKTLDDMTIGATSNYDLGLGAISYFVQIDGVSSPNTYTWGTYTEAGVQTTIGSGVSITGSEQTLAHGVKIKFNATTGHSLNSVWYIAYDGPESYGIRVGTGTHTTYIENVHIFGQGLIDLNLQNNIQPSNLVATTSACVLFHGRVRYCSVTDISMQNGMRSVMMYGENNGTYLQGGLTQGGTDFAAEYIDVLRTKTYSTSILGSGILMGHPSHRGSLRFIRVNNNFIQTTATPIEPNYQCQDYQVIGNLCDGTVAVRGIHCWRKSINGTITGNRIVNAPNAVAAVEISAPGIWETGQNIYTDASNILSGPVQGYLYASDVLGLLGPTSYFIATSGAYAASYPLTQATNLQPVTLWADQSGARHSAVPPLLTDAPTYKSSTSALTFAANRYMPHNFGTSDPVAMTIVAKIQVPNIATASNTFWHHRSETTRLIQLGVSSSNVTLQLRSSGNVLQTVMKAATANNTYMKIIAEFDKVGNLHRLYVDNLTSPGTNTTNFGAETFTSSIQSIGAYNIAGSITRTFTGDIQILAVYDKLFNDTQKQAILDAL